MSAGLRELHIAFNVANRRAGGTGPACDGPDCQVCADLLKAAGDAAPRVAASELWPYVEGLERACWKRKWSEVKAARKALSRFLGPRPHFSPFDDAPPATSGSGDEAREEQEKNAGLPR